VLRSARGADDPGPDPQDLLDCAVAMIRSANKFPDSKKRDRGSVLYRELGDPWRSYPAFHIAGTNGKGSISSYLSHILCHAGHKVGWYTSPYLERFNERVRVLDGAQDLARYDGDQTFGEIPDGDIARLMDKIGEAARIIAAREGVASTQFDMMTALAFLWFQEQACDVVVLETGMGGRLDSTNVIEKPLASLIGALGFDHMERLGNSMREIAAEKAGIIKEGCPVFAYAPEDALLSLSDASEVRQVIDRRCHALLAPLTFLGYHDFDLLSYDWSGQEFQTKKDGRLYRTRLLGPYQPVYALMAGEAVLSSGMADQDAVRRGIADCVWPARMEILAQDPLILLDGAHNVQAGLGLREALGKLACDIPVVFVIGLLKDKEHKEMLKALFLDPPYTVTDVIATEPPDARRFAAEKLIEELVSVLPDPKLIRMIDLPDISQAMAEAIGRARRKGAMICVCGSLYLAGVVRPLVREGFYK
ncbi:MAG: bifunctional folylpolyglutamate synthase/dihydrofolate synthase, partial [Clostridiaceae bacterium]|nr:bifunctional folylpolyglutamate synthase/dihydrofolate synthase [Clostridiaceae bacterium]